MGGVSQDPVLELILFSSFINNVDSGIDCKLIKFADNNQLNGVPDTLEGRMTEGPCQADWFPMNIMKFNKEKCYILHLDQYR